VVSVASAGGRGSWPTDGRRERPEEGPESPEEEAEDEDEPDADEEVEEETSERDEGRRVSTEVFGICTRMAQSIINPE